MAIIDAQKFNNFDMRNTKVLASNDFSQSMNFSYSEMSDSFIVSSTIQHSSLKSFGKISIFAIRGVVNGTCLVGKRLWNVIVIHKNVVGSGEQPHHV